jgi:hypothetical protein
MNAYRARGNRATIRPTFVAGSRRLISAATVRERRREGVHPRSFFRRVRMGVPVIVSLARAVPMRFMILQVVLLTSTGCNLISRQAANWVQNGDPRNGVTFYIGGAGTVGNVGAWSIPQGLSDAGYRGWVEVYTWQTVTAADQMALSRNLEKAAELAERIRLQKRHHPTVPVNIIALSAGTGLATFAMERLPEYVQVETVVFMGSSLSSRYDLTRALRRVNNRLYVLYSSKDGVLKHFVPIAGTVDRKDADYGVAGLNGMFKPRRGGEDLDQQYAKVRNVAWRPEFARYGNNGRHISAVDRRFIGRYIAPVILAGDRRALAAQNARTAPARDETDPADNRADDRADPGDAVRDSHDADSESSGQTDNARRAESATRRAPR